MLSGYELHLRAGIAGRQPFHRLRRAPAQTRPGRRRRRQWRFQDDSSRRGLDSENQHRTRRRVHQGRHLQGKNPRGFLLWGSYGKLPKKITLSPHIEYRNGFPYQPTNVYQQYVAVTGPQYRYPNYFSADMADLKRP